MCTRKYTLAHYLGAPSIDDVIRHNKRITRNTASILSICSQPLAAYSPGWSLKLPFLWPGSTRTPHPLQAWPNKRFLQFLSIKEPFSSSKPGKFRGQQVLPKSLLSAPLTIKFCWQLLSIKVRLTHKSSQFSQFSILFQQWRGSGKTICVRRQSINVLNNTD